MFYENVRDACKRHGTTITEVLHALGRSSGSTGTWKSGRLPKLELAMEIADHLGISLDELCYGPEHISKWMPEPAAPDSPLTDDQQEWLDIVSLIPADKQELCKDFLRTHMVVPEKYVAGKRA